MGILPMICLVKHGLEGRATFTVADIVIPTRFSLNGAATMRISRRALMVLPVLAALAVPASAQPGRGRPSEPLMMALDKNKDGELSPAELKDASKTLKELDKNKDGEIVRDEIRAFMMSRFGGQRPGGERPGGNTGSSRGGGSGSSGSSTLERSGLKIGGPAPDVTVYDAEGKDFSLSSLRGSHAVLVFGCLT
jgi:hypothetical protein